MRHIAAGFVPLGKTAWMPGRLWELLYGKPAPGLGDAGAFG